MNKPVDDGITLGRLKQSQDHSQSCRLSRSVRSKQSVDLARPHFKRKSINGNKGLAARNEVASQFIDGDHRLSAEMVARVVS